MTLSFVVSSNTMKIAILYHSETGNTANVAELIADGAKGVHGADVKTMSIDALDADFVKQASAVVFGCPTYAVSMSWQMKKFLDTTNLDLDGKLGGVFVTANYVGGGAEIAELTMIAALLLRGMLVYSAGFTCGNPLTHLGAVAIQSGDDAQRKRAQIFGERMAQKANELFM